MTDTHPGIEIRLWDDRGEIFSGRSDKLHFELAAYWQHAGFDPGSLYQQALRGPVYLEVRAVDVPALPAAPDTLAELAELADVDQAPGHRPCCCHGGFSGDHVCCIHPAAAAADVDQAAAELAAAPDMTAPPDAERSGGAVALTSSEPRRWLAGLGRAIGHRARRARFLPAR